MHVYSTVRYRQEEERADVMKLVEHHTLVDKLAPVGHELRSRRARLRAFLEDPHSSRPAKVLPVEN